MATAGTVYRTKGSVHDLVPVEGVEIPTEAAGAIYTVASNIESIIEVAENIPGDLASIPEAVEQANAAATSAAGSAAEAAAAAASAAGTDEIARAHAEAAAASANTAAGSATAAQEALEGAQGVQEQVLLAATATAEDVALAERWANELPGVEVQPGQFSGRHYASVVEALFASAPTLQGRYFGTHAGEEGADGATQTFNNALLDFGRAIIVKRLADRPTKLKLLPGLFTGPPKPDADFALAPLYVINASAAGSYVEIEAPDAGGGGVLKPSVIASDIDATHTTATAAAATTRTITLDIPAGSNRRVVVIAGSIHNVIPSGGPALSSPNAAITGITQRGAAGTGAFDGAAPIIGRLFEAQVSGSAAVPGCQFKLDVPAAWVSIAWRVMVLQNVSGTEDYALVSRTGAATSETQGFTPSQPGSTTIVAALHQGADAHPVTVTPRDSIVQGKTTGGRSLRDFAYGVAVDLDAAASSEVYTGSSAYASPALIGGLVCLPVTTGGGAGNLIWKGTAPPRVQPGEQAVICALSDGSTYLLNYLPAP